MSAHAEEESPRVSHPERRTAPFRLDRARAGAGRIPRPREALDGRHLPVREYEGARRIGRPRHGGAGGIWRAGLTRLRYRARPRRDRQGLLRDGNGGPGGGWWADPG